MTLLIKNATIVNADKVFRLAKDILIEKGTIVKIADSLGSGGHNVFDAQGKLVFPGLIDLHSHLREPGREDKETIETGSKAAAKGGFTSVFCMPNTNPVIDNAMVVDGVLKKAKRVGLVNIFPVGAISKGQKGEDFVDVFELKQAGCRALSDDGKSVLNTQLMRHAMEYAKMAGLFLIDHCEDLYLGKHGVMHEGYISTILGLKGIPEVTETIIVARDIELARYLNCPIHLAHISLKRSVELIRFAKSQGIRVTAEVCPHHFTLTDEAVQTFDTNTKVNPPLRTPEDVRALREALKDGTIDCIATDHAPHTREEKELEFDHAPAGIIGFETAVGLVLTELVEKKILSYEQVAERMSFRPAQIVGLRNKGQIKEGFDADLTVIDPRKEWIVRGEDFASKSRNSPFIGKRLKGRVETTICSGKIIYQNSDK